MLKSVVLPYLMGGDVSCVKPFSFRLRCGFAETASVWRRMELGDGSTLQEKTSPWRAATMEVENYENGRFLPQMITNRAYTPGESKCRVYHGDIRMELKLFW